MDLHFTSAEATPDERAAVDAVLGSPRSGWEGGARSNLDGHVVTNGSARVQRAQLLPVFHSLNDRLGWISAGAINYACLRLGVPPAEAYGVASFYGLLSTAPRGQVVVHICDDIACKLRGADELCEAAQESFAGANESDGKTTWQRSPCLGMCDRAPAVLIIANGKASSASAAEIAIAPASVSQVTAPQRALASPPSWPRAVAVSMPEPRLLARIGRVNPTSIDDYRATGGFTALARAIEIGRERTIAEVVESKLMGRGGAAFPTGRKWESVAREAAQPHYIICNADESEPGTFKDRVLMEEDPFAILEGMAIAAFAGGCSHGYVYVRGEYPLAAQRLHHAIAAARQAGILGAKVAGSSFDFDIELRRGAGAYICGEETALFNSVEGFRGEPRNKPPFPTQKGLFGKPTIVNNVETLANVPDILRNGGKAFAAIGTAGSTGTKLFCMSGHVARPGLYEVPLGTKLSALIDLAGGVPGGKKLQAVLLGGAAGSFIAPKELDLDLSFEGARAIGASIGSGVVMLFDKSADLAATLLRIAAFFRDESCGQCVPCRVGTVRQEELLHRLAIRQPLGSISQERELLADIGKVMRDASICGLGQTASSAIESALAKFDVFKHA